MGSYFSGRWILSLFVFVIYSFYLIDDVEARRFPQSRSFRSSKSPIFYRRPARNRRIDNMEQGNHGTSIRGGKFKDAFSIVDMAVLAQARPPIIYRHPRANRRAHSAGYGNRGTGLRGRRGLCDETMVLMPGRDVGITASGNPRLWLLAQDVRSLQLDVVDSRLNKSVFSWQSGQQLENGLVGIPLPKQVLVADRRYRWKLVVSCLDVSGAITKGKKLSGDFYRVDAGVEESLHLALQDARDSRRRLEIYAERGIWHELITELLNLRRQEPNNSAWHDDWAALLRSPDLQLEQEDYTAFLKAAITSCCENQ
jgi:hypothetical protein